VAQLLLLVEAMSKSANEEYADAADALQHQLWYNGEILDLCYDALKTYKDQSIASVFLFLPVYVPSPPQQILARNGAHRLCSSSAVRGVGEDQRRDVRAEEARQEEEEAQGARE